MSVIGSEILAGASGNQGYFIQKSLRFRSSASAYLSRTFANASTDRKKLTYSGWAKRGKLGATQVLLDAYDGSSAAEFQLYFDSNDTLSLTFGGAAAYQVSSSAVYRDPSAWYHIVLSIDTTQATAANRVIFYVNGSQITSYSVANYPPQNNSAMFPALSGNNKIGSNWNSGSGFFDGYMTEVNFIDGQALTPSSFGEYSTQTGVWQAKKYSGTYGTNGFYLPFSNNSSTTTLGYDFSGNGNNWTTNNISLTAGATYDSMVDVPTVGELASNYAVLNPLFISKQSSWTLSNGNLQGTPNVSGTGYTVTFATIPVSSGKIYAEFVISAVGAASIHSALAMGVNTSPETFEGTGDIALNETGVGYLIQLNNGNKNTNGSSTSYGSAFTVNDVINFAFDMDAGKVYWGKNGTWFASGNPATGTNPAFSSISSGTYSIGLQDYSATGYPCTWQANFGQRPFAYTPPTGFKALNTYNLPTPTIGATASTQANKYFDISLWTGDGATNRTITNSGSFKPDLVWNKGRSAAWENFLQDSIRGATNFLISSSTAAEATTLPYIVSSFESNGFVIKNNGNSNNNGDTYVAWQWKANGTGVTNTAGSITSTVSANTTSGFSVVTYTSPNNAADQTVGHGLGVAPSLIIVKNRDNTYNWDIYHKSLGYNSSLIFTTASTRSGAFGAEPTSTVFTTKNTYTHYSTHKYVAYCFAEVAGFSKFGSYTGNGSSDGTFVYTGFRPRYILFKRTDSSSSGDWVIYDTSRDTFNVSTKYLLPNSSAAEGSYQNPDILSNGFKMRDSASLNQPNGNYIYAAFAENPFKYSLAR